LITQVASARRTAALGARTIWDIQMKIKENVETSETDRIEWEVRWDFAGLLLALVIACILIFLLDTGSLAEWVAKHKHSKVDEAIVATVVLLVVLSFFFMRKWLALSSRLLRYGKSKQHDDLCETTRLKNTQLRDLVGLFVALAIAVVLVLLFDTGSIAEWISRHKETKVDEAIVVAAILLVGLCFFSVRRWLELSAQIARYQELHIRTSKLSRESALLGELSELLQSCLSSEEAHHLITDRAQILFPRSSGALCVTASSRDLVEVVATWGEPTLAERYFAPMDCWGLRRGRVHLLADDPTVLSCAHLGGFRPHRSMCVPMMAHGEALGLLYLDTGRNETKKPLESPAQLSESEQRLARTFAEQAALALANLNMREILKMQSVRDPLTGLYNRRYMEESLERELRRASRKNSTIGLMMLDVDHFKRFNDAFGHEAGDSVLRMLGNLFKTHFRGEDVVCRYGGEEFTIILPEASLKITQERAEQLREVVKKDVAQLRGQSLEPVSLSIGISNFPANGATGDALLRAADAALYRAKEEGRDRGVVAR